jgi:hypothetical protein
LIGGMECPNKLSKSVAKMRISNGRIIPPLSHHLSLKSPGPVKELTR